MLSERWMVLPVPLRQLAGIISTYSLIRSERQHSSLRSKLQLRLRGSKLQKILQHHQVIMRVQRKAW